MPIFSQSIYFMLKQKGYARCTTAQANYDYTRENVKLQIDMCWEKNGVYTFVLIYTLGHMRRWAGTFDMGDELPFTIRGSETDNTWDCQEVVPSDIFPESQ